MIRATMLALVLALPGAALAHHGGPHPPVYAQAGSIHDQQRQPVRPDVTASAQSQRRDAEMADALGGEGVAQLLLSARQAVQARRNGPANELLERAESRLLTRGTHPARAGEPVRGGPIRHISAARAALRQRDPNTALAEIDNALSILAARRPGRAR